MNETNQPSDVELTSRIAKLETELGRQNENFDQVNKRFDDLTGQLASLCDALGQAGPAQAQADDSDAEGNLPSDGVSSADPSQLTLFQDVEAAVSEPHDGMNQNPTYAAASVEQVTDVSIQESMSALTHSDAMANQPGADEPDLSTETQSWGEERSDENKHPGFGEPESEGEQVWNEAAEEIDSSDHTLEVETHSDFGDPQKTDCTQEFESANEAEQETEAPMDAAEVSTADEDQPLEALLSSLNAQFAECNPNEGLESQTADSLESEASTDTQSELSDLTSRGDELKELFASLKSGEDELPSSDTETEPKGDENVESFLASENSDGETETTATADLVRELSSAFDSQPESGENIAEPAQEFQPEEAHDTDSTPDPATESTVGTAPGSKNESVAEVLARMQCMPELENSEPAEPVNVESPSPSPISVEPAVAASSDSNDENTEDVQDYMNSLLQRLGGGPAAPETEAALEPVDSETEANQEEEDQEEFSPPQNLLKPGEFKPKQIAPEAESDLRAMRALANASTRSALSSSKQRQTQQMAHTMLLLAIGGLPAAAVAWTMSGATGDAQFWVAVGLFVMTISCTGLFLKMAFAGKRSPAAISTEPLAAFTAKWNQFTAFVTRKFRRNHEADN